MLRESAILVSRVHFCCVRVVARLAGFGVSSRAASICSNRRLKVISGQSSTTIPDDGHPLASLDVIEPVSEKHIRPYCKRSLTAFLATLRTCRWLRLELRRREFRREFTRLFDNRIRWSFTHTAVHEANAGDVSNRSVVFFHVIVRIEGSSNKLLF